MIVGLGLDLTALDRIEHSLNRFGDRFLLRILSDKEREQLASLRPALVPHVAGRFAAKEAAVKALGTGFAQGITLHHVEVLAKDGGAPCLCLHGPALEQAHFLGARHWHISITHERHAAAAVVILEA